MEKEEISDERYRIEIEGKYNRGEDVLIYLDGNFVYSWTSSDLANSDECDESCKYAILLYRYNPKELIKICELIQQNDSIIKQHIINHSKKILHPSLIREVVPIQNL